MLLDSIHPPQNNFQPRPPKRRFRLRFFLALLVLALLAGGIFMGSRLVIFAQKIIEREGVEFSFRRLFMGDDKTLKGEEQGEIRVLLMGIGGEGHDGGTLSDTMILATLKISEGEDPQVGLVSIPRDLVVDIPGHDFLKINSAYAYGGSALAVKTVEKLLNVEIPYYGVIDFAGFKQIIDDLGGVEINVQEGFTDALFPNEKGGYLAPLTFEPGKQKMDGTRALQFVRSRHGNNNQGSDFARARRQQQLLKAVKDEITSFRVLSNLTLINRLLDDLGNHIRTNLQPHEIKRFYDLGKDIKNENIFSLTIDGQFGLVCDQIVEETGAYVLVPCAGLTNYGPMRELVKNQFLLAGLETEHPSIEIQNTSNVDFLSGRVKAIIGQPFLEITTSNYRGTAAFQSNTLYDNTGGAKPKTLQYLKEKLGLRLAAGPFPFPTATLNADFVIILTEDIKTKLP